MTKPFAHAVLGMALTAAAVAAMTGPASAAAPEPRPGDLSSDYPTVPCDPQGPTAADGALAASLNTRLSATMRGRMTAYRVSCARMVVQAVRARGLHPRAAAIAITTTIVESAIENISVEVDHDSLGLFQQIAAWGSRSQRLDPTWATNAFLTKMLAAYPNNSWLTAPIGEVCQAVQVSDYPARYQPEAGDGQLIADALWAGPAAEEHTVQFADIDGDTRAELISITPDGNVRAFRNRGWDAAKVYDGPDSKLVAEGFTDARRVRFADLDGDARAELISTNPDGSTQAFRNQGWTATKVYDGPNSKVVAQGFDANRIKFADIDGDTRAEIVAVYADGSVRAFRNRGWDAAKVYDGPDSKLVAEGFTDPDRTRFADVDGDARAELISTNPDGSIQAFRNQGWTAAKVYDGPNSKVVAQGFTDPRRVKVADIDGDIRAELISINPDGNTQAFRNQGWTAAKVYDGPNNKTVAQGFVV